MDEPHPCTPAIALPGASWSDRRWLVLLLLITIALRGWQIYNTEVTTRDSITYARYAWRLENEPWGKVIRTEIQHPGYGFLIYFVAQPLQALFSTDLPRTMQLAAQLASSLASVLLLFPMYYLGKELFDPRVAFWSALLLQILPSSGQLMPDGLSEPLFLLLVTSALYAATRALNGAGIIWYLITGLATGLAYLTRTEGLLIVPMVCVVLLLTRWNVRWRRPWLVMMREGGAVCTACLLVVGPFMLHIGGISLKSSYKHITSPEGWKMPKDSKTAQRPEIVNSPLPLAVWWIGPNVTPRDRIGWAAWALVVMLDKGFFHLLTLPTVIGLWLFRRRFVEVPGALVMLLSGGTLMLLLWRLGQSAGYIGERHVLLLVLGGLFFAVAALGALAARFRPDRQMGVALLLLLGISAACMPKALARLHGNRAGFREAGVWLAQHAKPGDEVFDPLSWTAYHAGRVFTPSDAPRSDPAVCYVVVEQSKNNHPHLWYLMDLAGDLVKNGTIVHRLPTRRGAEIVIYRVPRPPSNNPTGASLDRWLATSLRR